MTYGADQMKCPACGGLATCESVDVGVGLVIRGDFSCACGWEIDAEGDFGFIEEHEIEFPPVEAYET